MSAATAVHDDEPQTCGFCGWPIHSDDYQDYVTGMHKECWAAEHAEVRRDERMDEEAER